VERADVPYLSSSTYEDLMLTYDVLVHLVAAAKIEVFLAGFVLVIGHPGM
jgi:hypothetical protein